MIRRPDLHWPAVAGSLLVVAAAAACVPAKADPRLLRTPRPRPTTSAARPSSPATASSPSPAATPTPKCHQGADHLSGSPDQPTKTVRPGTAVRTLATLTIKGRAPKTGYDRDLFGQAWADVDRNGCDTRNDILRRDLPRTTLKARHATAAWSSRAPSNDPYTGTKIGFVRGQGTSNAVQVDHVVALSDAWQKGAQRWSTTTRTAFANDPLNLLAVDGPDQPAQGRRRRRHLAAAAQGASAARTSRARSRSSTATGCRSPRPSGTRWCGCSPRARRSRCPAEAGAVAAREILRQRRVDLAD